MVAELVKTIKPKKLRTDQIRLNILNELRKEGRLIRREFQKTTQTWEGSKPRFEIQIGLDQRDAIVIVGPTGSERAVSKWVFLDEGTRPHIITAKKAPNLVFRGGSGFRAKTKVKTFSSGPGANSGPWVSKKSVRHPGIQAREWSKTIAQRRRKPFTRNIIKAARI